MASNKDPSSKKPNSLINAVDPKLEDLRKELERDYSQASSDIAAKRIAQSEYEQRIGSIAKRIGSQINTIANTSSMEALVTKSITSNDSFRSLAQSRKDLMNMSTSSLQEVVRKSTSLASMEAKSLASMTIQSRPNGSGGLEGTYEQKSSERRARISHYVQEAGLAKVAIRLQNRLGTSSEKEDQLYDSMSNRTSSLQEKKELQEMLKSRRVGSYKDELARLKTTQGAFETAYSKKINAQESLSIAGEAMSEAEAREKSARAMYESDSSEKNKKALEEASKSVSDFAAVLEKAAQDTEDASNAFKNATKELEKQQRITSVAQDRDDGGGRLKYAVAAGGIVANELQYNLVDQKLRAQQARSSIAQYGLRQYDRAFAATQGDVQSLFEIGMSDKTGEFANSIYGSQLGAKAAIETARGAENVLNAVGGFKSGDPSKIINGIGGIGGQIVRNVGKNNDFQILAAEKQMDANQIQDQLNSALVAFRAKGGQRIFDQFMGATPAIVGSGSQALEGKLTDLGSLQNALNKGNLAPSELLSLSTQVNETVRGSKNDRYDVAVRAGELQKGRVMSAGQYVQAMSAQANIGGTQGGLESNLRRAFAAGINDSKLLTEFVELNSGLNQGLADIGIALETNNAFANKVQEFMGKGMSESLASKAAANSISNMGSFMANLNAGPGAIAQSAVIQSAVKKVTGRGISDAELVALQTADEKKLQLLLGEKALNSSELSGLTDAELDTYNMARSAGEEGRKYLRYQVGSVSRRAAVNAETYDKVGRHLYGIRDRDVDLNLEQAQERNFVLQSGAQERAKAISGGMQLKEMKDSVSMTGQPDAKSFMETLVNAMQSQMEKTSTKEAEKSVQSQVAEMKSEQMFSNSVKEFGEWVQVLKGDVKPRVDPAIEAQRKNQSDYEMKVWTRR